MSINNDDRAKRMVDLINMAPMSDNVRKQFNDWAMSNNAEKIWKYFTACINKRPDIGNNVKKSGKTSFEDIFEKVKEIYFSKK